MKKVLAVIITLVLALGAFSVPAFAASEPLVYSFAEEGHIGWEYTDYSAAHDAQLIAEIVHDSANGIAKSQIPAGTASGTTHFFLSLASDEAHAIDTTKYTHLKLRLRADFTNSANLIFTIRDTVTWFMCDLGLLDSVVDKDVTVDLASYYTGWSSIGKLGVDQQLLLQVANAASGDIEAGDWFGIEYIAFFENEADCNAFNYENWLSAQTPEESSEAEESKTEESKTEESKTEESKTEESKTEESKTEESKTEESKTEESKPNADTGNLGGYIGGAAALAAAAVVIAVIATKKKK